MDWNRVPTFLKVVDQGSFTAAAKALGVPKSTASRTVAALERELQAQLLHRTTRALELTDAGRAFYERAKAARAALEEAQAELHHEKDDASGVVRLSVPNDTWPLAELLGRFWRLHPQVHLELLVTNRRVSLVEEGVDLALRAGPLEDSTLVARKLAQSDLGLFASPEYLRRHPAPKTVEALARHQVVLFHGRQGKARLTLRGRDGEREVTVRGPVSSDDLCFTRAFVHRGLGLGLLPIFMSACAKKAPQLERVLPGWSVSGGGVHLVMPASRYVPARVRLLADFLHQNFTAATCGE